MQLQLATTRNFNGNELACYVEDKPVHDFNFWATREQIGRFLGYKNPDIAIGVIHKRNTERLDKFSTLFKMNKVEGNRTITRDVIVYNFKGLLEICRFSNQPKANEVMDILWDVFEEICRKGYYLTPNAESQILALKAENDKLAKHNNILLAQNAELWKHINDNSAFTLLGQAISLVHGTVSFGEGAKLFAQNGIDTGQNRLFATARDLKMLARRKGRQYNQPTQWAIDKGYCVMVVNIGSKGTPYLTVKGMQFLADFLAKKQLPLLALIDKCEALNE